MHRNGGYDAGTRFVQVEAQAPVYHVNKTGSPTPDSANMESPMPTQRPQQSQQVPDTDTSSSYYDPITGVGQENQPVPAPAEGYGLQREPAVETDATAGTIDSQALPGTAMENGNSDGLFESPVDPDVVQPGGMNDPNVRLPRIP